MERQEKQQRLTVNPYDHEKGKGTLGGVDVFLQPYRGKDYLVNNRARRVYRIEDERDDFAIVTLVTDKSLVHRILHESYKSHLGESRKQV